MRVILPRFDITHGIFAFGYPIVISLGRLLAEFIQPFLSQSLKVNQCRSGFRCHITDGLVVGGRIGTVRLIMCFHKFPIFKLPAANLCEQDGNGFLLTDL